VHVHQHAQLGRWRGSICFLGLIAIRKLLLLLLLLLLVWLLF
jgi:hypothetical protein